MSRSFDPIAGTHFVTFSPGSAAPNEGPITMAFLAKAANTGGWTGWGMRGMNGASAIWGHLTSSAKMFIEGDFGTGVSGLTTSWAWYVAKKASGTVAPRFGIFPIGSSWTFTDGSATVADRTGPIDTIFVGGAGGGTNGWRGSIAVAATWSSALSDTTIQNTFGLSASTVLAAGPNWMTRWNQSSTATSVTDDTGNGGNQSAITGTTVDADDPPGFDYSLTSPISPTGLAVPVALGSPTVLAGLTIAPSGLAVPVALGAPTVGATKGATVGGSWWQLDAVRQTNILNASMERKAGPLACPNDGEPLQWDPRSKRRRCPYDGWISPV